MLTKEDLQAIAGLLMPLETRIGGLEEKFNGFEGRIDKLEGRFDKLEGRFDKLEKRFEDFECETRNRFADMEANLRSVDKHVCELDSRVTNLSQTVRSLQLHVENHTDVRIQTLAENHLDLYRKLEEIQKKQEDQDRLWFYVKKHEKDITEIKQRLCMQNHITVRTCIKIHKSERLMIQLKYRR